ncbi:hypothetical protein [Streptomyces lutosisoli]|uniref:Uncharacterized protein n=1 Tax=Streptomyces lutosisoli TaxID=2665721 RepID=A0ABW2VQI4_9ACTN
MRVDAPADPDRTRVEVLAETCGRPLGLELLPDGVLLVRDARRGQGRSDTFVDDLPGQPDNLWRAPDGPI